MQALRQEKSLTEKEIEFYNLNFTVVNECLTLRDEKTSNDLCRDAVEAELNSVSDRLKRGSPLQPFGHLATAPGDF